MTIDTTHEPTPEKKYGGYPHFLMRWAFYYADKQQQESFQTYLNNQDYHSAKELMRTLIRDRYGVEKFYDRYGYPAFFKSSESNANNKTLTTYDFVRALSEINEQQSSKENHFDLSKQTIDNIAAIADSTHYHARLWTKKLSKPIAWTATIASVFLGYIGLILLVVSNDPTVAAGSLDLAIGGFFLATAASAAVATAGFLYNRFINNSIDWSIHSKKTGNQPTHTFKPVKKRLQDRAYGEEKEFNVVHDIYAHYYNSKEQKTFVRNVATVCLATTGYLRTYDAHNGLYSSPDKELFGDYVTLNSRIKTFFRNIHKENAYKTQRPVVAPQHFAKFGENLDATVTVKRPLKVKENETEHKPVTFKRIGAVEHSTYGKISVFAKEGQALKPAKLTLVAANKGPLSNDSSEAKEKVPAKLDANAVKFFIQGSQENYLRDNLEVVNTAAPMPE